MRKSCPWKFPGQLGHRAFGSRAQRSHRGLPGRVENYHVPWQGLLGHRQRPTGGGWHQRLLQGSRGSHGKVERMALRGLSSEQQILHNKGGFAKRQRKGGRDHVELSYSDVGKKTITHTTHRIPKLAGLDQIPPLPPTRSVTPDSRCHLSEPQFPHLENAGNNSTYLFQLGSIK